MMTPSGQRMALAAGTFVLGSLLLFCGIAIVSLLLTANNSQTSLFLLADPYIWHIAGFTLLQAVLSTGLSILGGIPLAIALHRRAEFPGRSLIVRLMLVPMRMPTLVVAFALIGIWGRQGWANQGLAYLGLSEPVSLYGLTGILIAHVFFNLPLTAQILLQGLDQVPSEYWRVAANLRMGPVATFRLIEWPVFRRLIPGLAGLIFILCATSFTLVLILGGGPGATTLEVAIYQSLHFDFDVVRAVTLSFLQIGLTSVLLIIVSQLPETGEPESTRGIVAQRFDGKSLPVVFLDIAVIVLGVVFVGLPLARIILSGFAANYPALLTSSLFWRAFSTSAILAILSMVLALWFTGLILLARHGLRSNRHSGLFSTLFSSGLSMAPSLVLLLPPVVLATGWFLLLPNPADTGWTGPVLVIILNAMMALPFTVRMIEPAYQVHVARVDRLAASLNIHGLVRLRRIDWPCLRPVILRAASLAMALSLGDLGAVALFGSDGFVTLPWLLFSKLGSYRSNDADGLALIIAVLCLALAGLGYARHNKETVRD